MMYANTIRTAEELNALTAWGTLIVELHHPGDGCSEDKFCWLLPVVWEMVNQMGWMRHSDGSFEDEPRLPALLLWHRDRVPADTEEEK